MKKEDIEVKAWKIEEIFQDIEDDPDNVKLIVPQEVIDYLELKEGEEFQVQVTENGLIFKKNS